MLRVLERWDVLLMFFQGFHQQREGTTQYHVPVRRIAEVNFFLVNMPASSPGQYGDYYCDANCVGGNCCAEFDINDAWTYQNRFTHILYIYIYYIYNTNYSLLS